MTDAEAIGIINDSMVNEFELDPEMMTPDSSVREINTLGDLHDLVLQKKRQLEAEKK
jgi:hypothetical protein